GAIINATILTLITIVVWVAYSVYDAYVRPVDVIVPPETLENFEPRLDAEALSALQQSIYLTEEELSQSVNVVVIPEPEDVEDEEATDEESDIEIVVSEEI